MSTIITHSMALGIPSILIDAPYSRTIITGTDITGHLVQIDGNAKSPFILGVRFTDCTIVAENLLAFKDCYFDQSCTMKVKACDPIYNNCIMKEEKAV